MWIVWDKTSNINALTADEFLARNEHLATEQTIYTKVVNDKVVQVEGKANLAKLYEIDTTLDDEAFIVKYEETMAEIEAAASLENYEPYMN